MITRLSSRQFSMLEKFANASGVFHMSIHEAQRYDQRAFRSMLIRKWIEYRPGKGFHLMREGRAAWVEFEEMEVWRKNPALPLTAYFDPVAYGLKDPYQKGRSFKLQVMPKARAAGAA